MSQAELTWKYCSTCSPNSKEDCIKCWEEWEQKETSR